jgi:hypothetical protein
LKRKTVCKCQFCQSAHLLHADRVDTELLLWNGN